VTPEFVTRVVGVLLDRRVDFRRAGRLFVIGDLRVPRVVVRGEFAASAAQVTFEIAPATEPTVTRTGSELVVTFAADAVDAAVPTVPANPLLQGIRRGDGATSCSRPARASSRIAPPCSRSTPARRGSSSTCWPPAPRRSAGRAGPPPHCQRQAPGIRVRLSLPPPGGFRTIVIDPGHGGEANGTEGPGGTLKRPSRCR
jgi:N-acetylmuramoyl-L-alanine amidase